MVSSQSELPHQISEDLFDEVTKNEFAFERKRTRTFWKEQCKQPLEVLPWWTKPEDSSSTYISYSKTQNEAAQVSMHAQGDQIKSINWALDASQKLHRLKRSIPLTAVLASSLIALTGPLWAKSLGILMFYLAIRTLLLKAGSPDEKLG